MTTSEDGCPCRSAVARWCARCRKPPFQQHKHNASVSAKRTKCARLLFAIKNFHSPASSQFWAATGSDIHRHRRCARRLRQLPTFLKQVPRWELQPPARWGAAKVVLASNSPVGSQSLWLGFSEVQTMIQREPAPQAALFCAPPPRRDGRRHARRHLARLCHRRSPRGRAAPRAAGRATRACRGDIRCGALALLRLLLPSATRRWAARA